MIETRVFKIKSAVALLAAAILTALISACAATDSRQSTGQNIDDAAITARVKAAFVGDDRVEARSVNVETYSGVVQLRGFAETNQQVQAAAAIARDVPGVRSVRNDERLKNKPQ